MDARLYRAEQKFYDNYYKGCCNISGIARCLTQADFYAKKRLFSAKTAFLHEKNVFLAQKTAWVKHRAIPEHSNRS